MDYLYVPSQFSVDHYSSFVDPETANDLPALSHTSDASSRCSTPKTLARDWDHAVVQPAFVDHNGVWYPQPQMSRKEPSEHEDSLSRHSSHPRLGMFGSREAPGSVSPHLLGPSFNDIMKELENQQPFEEALSYQPAYEPLSWTYSNQQSQSEPTWPQASVSSHIAPPPMHMDDAGTSVYGQPPSFSYEPAFGSFAGPNSVVTPQPASSYPPSTLAAPRTSSPAGSGKSSSAARKRRQSRAAEEALLQQQHECTTCSWKFARGRDLSRHMRLHTGERPYECLGCGDRFIRVDARKRHWNTRPQCQVTHANLSGA